MLEIYLHRYLYAGTERIYLVYEYAGGGSSAPSVAVDGPGMAEGGSLVEYVAKEDVSISQT